ncbi:beta-propeller fold lactonase family protein [Vibrio gangliei]|uniref:beta-propeller fold lactonase family protein n=1 Tax=Vibrio gangliei TaxID=2077090 RepID=UPI000D020693|nr:beta-propeller fold lactonase family protein [Vibrio gangliei]
MKCVYVSSPTSQQLHVFELKATGGLELLQIVATPGEVQPVTISADGLYLYAAVRPNFAVVTYLIESDGRLTHVANTALPKSASSSCLDASGQFLLLTSYAQNGLMVSPLVNDIAQAPMQVLENLTKAHCVISVSDPDLSASTADIEQQTLFVTCLGDDKIRLYRFDKQGQLQPHSQPWLETQSGAGPRHLVASKNGRHLYVINELDGDVLHFTLQDDRNHWQLAQRLSYIELQNDEVHWAADIHLTTDERHLFVSERTQHTMTCFSVDPDSGDLSLHDQLLTESIPRGFDLDPYDQFLLCAGQGSDHVSVYAIDSKSRHLARVERQPVGREPMWVRVLQR